MLTAGISIPAFFKFIIMSLDTLRLSQSNNVHKLCTRINNVQNIVSNHFYDVRNDSNDLRLDSIFINVNLQYPKRKVIKYRKTI